LKILITGSEGLIGRGFKDEIRNSEYEFSGIDTAARPGSPDCGDVRDPEKVAAAIDDCDGVLHLAAVSRVVWGQNDPVLCRSVNVDGTRNVIEAALASPKKPWVIFAGSREIYGEPESLPVKETDKLVPVNVYGDTKLAGEEMTLDARTNGLKTAIVRFSNVYGRTYDHHDRVVPAFAAAAAFGNPMRIDGPDNTFDFTHIDDTVQGLQLLVKKLIHEKESVDAIHFLTGVPTTLGELARTANDIAGKKSELNIAPSRNYDVSRFFGDPARAEEVLGWKPSTSIGAGLTNLIDELRK